MRCTPLVVGALLTLLMTGCEWTPFARDYSCSEDGLARLADLERVVQAADTVGWEGAPTGADDCDSGGEAGVTANLKLPVNRAVGVVQGEWECEVAAKKRWHGRLRCSAEDLSFRVDVDRHGGNSSLWFLLRPGAA